MSSPPSGSWLPGPWSWTASSPAPIHFTGRRRRSATTSAIPIACCGSSLFPDLAVRLLDADAATAARVGPKAATLGRLQRAGLPVPDGVCLTADAYRRQVALASVARTAREVAGAGGPEARRLALSIRLALARAPLDPAVGRSEEHTSELQSQSNLVCRLLLEKKKIKTARGI